MIDPDVQRDLLDSLSRAQAQGDQLHAAMREDGEIQAAMVAAGEGLTQFAAALRVAGIQRDVALPTLAGFCASTADVLIRALWDRDPPFRGQRRGH